MLLQIIKVLTKNNTNISKYIDLWEQVWEWSWVAWWLICIKIVDIICDRLKHIIKDSVIFVII